MRIKYQVDISVTEFFKAKITFDREAQSQGVVINGYHTDNIIFNASEFMNYMLKNQQNIRFSGSDTSRQNGASLHTIDTLFTISSTMLMHTALRCPE